MVDLFAGPGGLDVGAHWLGVPSIGVECDEAAVSTREAAGLSSIHADVTMWRPEDFTDAVNVLAGGPPCQTYTVAGNGHGRKALTQVIELVEMLGEGAHRIDDVLAIVGDHEDKRTGLVLQPLIWALRAIEDGRPFKAILLEQVPAVRQVWDAVKEVLEDNGYGADVRVLRTEEYGVPQTRRRAVLAARLDVASENVRMPEGTHQKYTGTASHPESALDLFFAKPPWISMGQALGWAEGFTVISNYGSGGDPKNRSRRRHDRPAFTVTGKVSRNRVEMDSGGERRFNSSDAGRLQTFPADYPWSGTGIAQQIGNAIPPRLSTHVLSWLLGLDVGLDDDFFALRTAAWDGPSGDAARLVKSSIARTDVLGESLRTVIGHPLRVERSKDGQVELVGVVGHRAEVDAVEPKPGYRPRTTAAI